MVEPLNTKAWQSALDALGTVKANQLEPDLRIAVSAYISALPSLPVVDGGEVLAWFGEYAGKKRLAFDRSSTTSEPLVRQSALLAAESRVLSLEEEVKEAALHVEQLSELLKIIKEHWVDYDHVFSISVHEADTWLSGRQALSEGEQNG